MNESEKSRLWVQTELALGPPGAGSLVLPCLSYSTRLGLKADDWGDVTAGVVSKWSNLPLSLEKGP